MRGATPAMRDCAKILGAYEDRRNKSSDARPSATFPVCDKLGPHLTTLVGKAGYRALLLRALALAGAEAPWLRGVRVRADGTFDGLEDAHATLDAHEFIAGRTLLMAHLLGLLVAFIGESLTLRLVREVWPKVPLDDLNFGNGGNNEKTT